MKKKYYQSYAWMHKRYVVDNMTIAQIARECEVSTTTIQTWLENHGLIRNGRTWKNK